MNPIFVVFHDEGEDWGVVRLDGVFPKVVSGPYQSVNVAAHVCQLRALQEGEYADYIVWPAEHEALRQFYMDKLRVTMLPGTCWVARAGAWKVLHAAHKENSSEKERGR